MCHACVRISHAECHVASKIPSSKDKRENCFSFLSLQDCTVTQIYVINLERFFSSLLSWSWTLPWTEGYIEILQMLIIGVNCNIYSAAGLKFSLCHEVCLCLGVWRLARPWQRCLILCDASCSIWVLFWSSGLREVRVLRFARITTAWMFWIETKNQHKTDRWSLPQTFTTNTVQRWQR